MYGVPADLPLHRFIGDSLTQAGIGCDGVHFRFARAGTISAYGLWQLRDSAGRLIDQTQEHAEREYYRIHFILNADVTACSIDAPRSFSLTFSTGHQLSFFDDTPQYESCEVGFEGGPEVVIQLLNREMHMPFVYFVTSELVAQDGNEMKIPPGRTVFAQMVVPALSLQRALPVVSAAWAEQRYRFVDVLVSQRFNMDNWDFEEHPEASIERVLCLRAINTGSVEYGVVITGGD